MAKKKVGNAEIARLKVLGASDGSGFRAHVEELLRSGDRMAREAALEALLHRPVPALRPLIRDLYLELDADGPKRDQGAPMRSAIIQLLKDLGDLRDVDIAKRAIDTHETAFGEDNTWRLRIYGFRMLAEVEPELFPFFAVEAIFPEEREQRHEEEASTVLQLLAAMGQLPIVYLWLKTGARPPATIAAVFGLLAEGRKDMAERYARTAIGTAIRTENDSLAIILAETIVNAEMESLYGALADLMSSKVSDELYEYLAILLAGTGRPPLLRILEQQLRRGRRPKVVAAALRVRTTPESEAILKRWDEGDEYDPDDA